MTYMFEFAVENFTSFTSGVVDGLTAGTSPPVSCLSEKHFEKVISPNSGIRNHGDDLVAASAKAHPETCFQGIVEALEKIASGMAEANRVPEVTWSASCFGEKHFEKVIETDIGLCNHGVALHASSAKTHLVKSFQGIAEAFEKMARGFAKANSVPEVTCSESCIDEQYFEKVQESNSGFCNHGSVLSVACAKAYSEKCFQDLAGSLEKIARGIAEANSVPEVTWSESCLSEKHFETVIDSNSGLRNYGDVLRVACAEAYPESCFQGIAGAWKAIARGVAQANRMPEVTLSESCFGEKHFEKVVVSHGGLQNHIDVLRVACAKAYPERCFQGIAGSLEKIAKGIAEANRMPEVI